MKKLIILASIILSKISLATVYGHCNLEYYDISNYDLLYPNYYVDIYTEFKFYIPNTEILVYNKVIKIKDDFSYHFETDELTPGAYDIVVYGDRWLHKRVFNKYISNSDKTEINVSLTTGDTNCDNVIDLNDYNLILRHFNSYKRGLNYSEKCNLNGDNLIDMGDLSICAFNFGKRGD